VVVMLLEIEGEGPEEMFFPMKWVEVSGEAEHLSEPGVWMISPELVSAEWREVVS